MDPGIDCHLTTSMPGSITFLCLQLAATAAST